MNIFFLDRDIATSAKMHCDKHVVKMILEYAQLLSSAHHIAGIPLEGIYKKTHINHPCAVWVRQSTSHYEYLFNLMHSLMHEYTYRYGKHHATERLLPLLNEKPRFMNQMHWNDPPQCMPDQYKKACVVDAYRHYYIGEKHSFAKWKNRDVPFWYRPVDNEAILS
jgi:hypothetical protein